MKRTSKVAILAIDPGETTGVAAARVDLSYLDALPTLRNAENKKSMEVTGNYLEQGLHLAEIMNKFVFTMNTRFMIPTYQIHIVIENFVLRRTRQGGATGNLTSCWVGGAAVGAFGDDTLITWQNASDAKSYATNDRLQMWDMYERGSAHMRDANRHLALKVNKLLG